MDYKIIRVTDKDQISLPVGMRQSLGINQGDDLIVTKTNDSVIIRKIRVDDYSDLLKNSETVAKKFWDNKEDEVWNNV